MSTTLQHFLKKRIDKPELRFKLKNNSSDSENESPEMPSVGGQSNPFLKRAFGKDP